MCCLSAEIAMVLTSLLRNFEISSAGESDENSCSHDAVPIIVSSRELI